MFLPYLGKFLFSGKSILGSHILRKSNHHRLVRNCSTIPHIFKSISYFSLSLSFVIRILQEKWVLGNLISQTIWNLWMWPLCKDKVTCSEYRNIYLNEVYLNLYICCKILSFIWCLQCSLFGPIFPSLNSTSHCFIFSISFYNCKKHSFK